MKTQYHIIFWSVSVIFLTIVFGHSYGGYVNAFFFVSMLLPIVVGTSYFFNQVLVQRFLLKKKYLKFTLYLIYSVIISFYLEILVIIVSFIILANYQYKNMGAASIDVFILTIVLYFFVFINSFILLIKQFYNNELKFKDLITENEIQKTDYLIVRANRKSQKLMLDEILYFESLSDYVKVHLQSSSVIITKEKISKIESRVPTFFLRIHRSFIVNSNKIDAFTKESVTINSLDLPISRTYKKKVLASIATLE